MFDESLHTLFPPQDEAMWRAAVESALGGRSLEERLVRETDEGLRIQPLYHAGNSRIGRRAVSSFPRRGELRQEFEHPDPVVVARQIEAEAKRGLQGVQLRGDRALRRAEGSKAEGVAEDGIALHDRGALQTCLGAVPEDMPVALDVGASGIGVATILLSIARSGSRRLTGCLGLDPLGTLAAEGRLPASAETELGRVADVAAWAHAHAPGLRTWAVDTSAHHHAGAHEALDLGLLASTGLAYLRAMEAAGLDVDAGSEQMLFRVRLDPAFFLAVAKLRALRRIWRRIVEQADGDAAGLRLQARLSERVVTRRDPWINILRNTAAGFAAAVGGADVFTSESFERRLGLSDEFGRRLARNSQILLEEESHLRRVVDPAAGSWFLEQLTEDLAREGWNQFRALEAEGGILAALRSGWIAARVESQHASRAEKVARRRDPLTGVSEFANLEERPPRLEEPDRPAIRRVAASAAAPIALPELPEPGSGEWTAALLEAADAGLGPDDVMAGLRDEPEECEALPLRPLAAPFEELRDAAEAHRRANGEEPAVFLATLGVLAEYNARATWVGNLLRAGGIVPRSGGDLDDADAVAAAFSASPTKVAVICSTDEIYAERAFDVAGRLRQCGAERILLAGRPGERESAFREAGIDDFVYVGADVLAHLRVMHEVLEVES